MSKASPPTVRSGFTLLEVIVILALMAVAAAVVAPAFRQPDRPNDDLRAIVAGARELAVRRAEALVLHVDNRGAWRLTPASDTTAVSSGVLDRAGQAARIRVTPLGACFNEAQSLGAAVDWDAISCAPRSGGSAR